MSEEDQFQTEFLLETKTLTAEEREKLELQNSRLISTYQATKINNESKKHWDLFYKRNDTRFFKDRHWTLREFKEVLGGNPNERSVLLEVGCGVGNFVYPLIEEQLNIFIYACDISSKAVELLKMNPNYSNKCIQAFQCDITTDSILKEIPKESIDILTLIFVLSAIDPSNYARIAQTLFVLLKPGGYILLRDYGLYDMTQLRFKPGHKLSDNFYMRQDGTRSYFFSVEVLEKLFADAGFVIVSNCYIRRRTVNIKEGIDVPRIFIQAKLKKPS